jgi:glycosyltransferase involved in cell wall biosynthesis
VNVTFLIRKLDYGGTERQLAAVASGLADRGHGVEIVQLFDGCEFDDELAAAGIEPVSLGLRGRRDVPRLVTGTLRRLHRSRPDVVYGLNVETNLLALLAGRLLGARVVLGIRVANPDALAEDTFARAAAALHRRLLGRADLVVANAVAGARYALAAGAPTERVRVIDNGIDVERFRPDPEGARDVRREWGVSGGEVLIGTVARLEAAKRPEIFLRAAAELARLDSRAKFVWVGDGEPEYQAGLERLAAELGLAGRLVWAGVRRDLPAVYTALDAATLLSVKEGASNALAEALACGRLCVVSNIGDSARVVGPHGIVVRSPDPLSIAHAWREVLRRSTAEARVAARGWVERGFPLARFVAETEAALAALL